MREFALIGEWTDFLREARLHETMYDILDGRHTLTAPLSEADMPKAVLDVSQHRRNSHDQSSL